jgi:hypothetical protein
VFFLLRTHFQFCIYRVLTTSYRYGMSIAHPIETRTRAQIIFPCHTLHAIIPRLTPTRVCSIIPLYAMLIDNSVNRHRRGGLPVGLHSRESGANRASSNSAPARCSTCHATDRAPSSYCWPVDAASNKARKLTVCKALRRASVRLPAIHQHPRATL